MSVIVLATGCLWSAKRLVDEWVYKKQKKSKTLLLCSGTWIKRDVGGNQVICVQDISEN